MLNKNLILYSVFVSTVTEHMTETCILCRLSFCVFCPLLCLVCTNGELQNATRAVHWLNSLGRIVDKQIFVGFCCLTFHYRYDSYKLLT